MNQVGLINAYTWLYNTLGLTLFLLCRNLCENLIVMRKVSFRLFINNINNLNTLQYRQLIEVIKSHESERLIPVNLETKYKDLICPHCSARKIHRWGKRNDLQRYRCFECRKTFNSLTGTPLACLRKKEKWLKYCQCLIDGYSVRKAAIICEVHWNTCFKWRHRFLANSTEIKADLLTGIVEADETYFLKSNKGQHNLVRKARKRGVKVNKRGLSEEHVCVFISRDRKGYVYDKVFNRFNSDELNKTFGSVILKDILFCSDSKAVYKKFTKENKIIHGSLNLSANERVRKKIVHVDNIYSYHSCLKRWMIRFNGVATKYLENYISWYRFLDEFNQDINPLTILLRSKLGGKYKSQPLFVT